MSHSRQPDRRLARSGFATPSLSPSSLPELILMLVLLLISGNAGADVFQAGEFRLSAGDSAQEYQLSARLPTDVISSVKLGWPVVCVQTRARQQTIGNQSMLVISAQCTRALQGGDLIRTPWPLDGARLTIDLGSEPVTVTLRPGRDGMILPLVPGAQAARSPAKLAPALLWQGVLHIWFGWDHLAFVLCLCLLARGYALLGLITAFTLGHSLSLGFAFFDVITIPIPPVEAVIALSIMMMAREAMLTDQDQTPHLQRALTIVIGFGLIHGLGFASALSALGVADDERWPALLFFNLGVELGQLVFVGLVITLLAFVRSPGLATLVRSAALYLAGSIGFFWTIERIAAFT